MLRVLIFITCVIFVTLLYTRVLPWTAKQIGTARDYRVVQFGETYKVQVFHLPFGWGDVWGPAIYTEDGMFTNTMYSEKQAIALIGRLREKDDVEKQKQLRKEVVVWP